MGLAPESPLLHFLNAFKNRNASDMAKAIEPWLTRDDELGLVARNALGYTLSLAGQRGKAMDVFWVCAKAWPENAVSRLNAAEVFRAAGMPMYAAQAYARLCAEYPGNPDAFALRYEALRDAGAKEQALQAAESAFAVFPQSAESSLNLAQAYLDLRRVAEARQVLARAIESKAGELSLILGLAELELRAGNASEALRLLETIGPSAGPSLHTKALAQAISGNWNQVVESLNAMPDSDHTPASRALAALGSIKAGNQEEASKQLGLLADLRPLIAPDIPACIHAAINPAVMPAHPDHAAFARALANDPEALADLTIAYACQAGGAYDDAIDAYGRVELKGMPGSQAILGPQFDCLARAVRLAAPAIKGREIVARHESSPEAWLGLARVLAGERDVAGQKEALDRAAALPNAGAPVFLERGLYFDLQKQPDKAIPEYQKAIELDPTNAIAHNNLAYCLLSNNGDARVALDHALRAIQGMPRSAVVLHTLGVAQLRTGDLVESRKNLESALESMPGEPTLMLDYGLLLAAQGDPDEGRQQVQAALSYAKLFGLDFPRKDEADRFIEQTSPSTGLGEAESAGSAGVGPTAPTEAPAAAEEASQT